MVIDYVDVFMCLGGWVGWESVLLMISKNEFIEQPHEWVENHQPADSAPPVGEPHQPTVPPPQSKDGARASGSGKGPSKDSGKGKGKGKNKKHKPNHGVRAREWACKFLYIYIY